MRPIEPTILICLFVRPSSEMRSRRRARRKNNTEKRSNGDVGQLSRRRTLATAGVTDGGRSRKHKHFRLAIRACASGISGHPTARSAVRPPPTCRKPPFSPAHVGFFPRRRLRLPGVSHQMDVTHTARAARAERPSRVVSVAPFLCVESVLARSVTSAPPSRQKNRRRGALPGGPTYHSSDSYQLTRKTNWMIRPDCASVTRNSSGLA
jgi:hypothetical protein